MIEEKLYKYYFYYIKSDNDKPELYAYTDNKELAKEFEIQRNMEIFSRVKHKLTRKALNDLVKEYPELSLELVTGYTKNNSYKSDSVEFHLVMTNVEKMSIISEYDNVINAKLWALTQNDPRLFNKDIKKALSYIDYEYGYANYFSSNPELISRYYDYICDYEMDLFGVFISIYGKLLKIGSE